MDAALVELLRCPYTSGSLRLEAFEHRGAEVAFGLLHGEGGTFPVVDGIPIMSNGHARLTDLVRAGEFRSALAWAALGEFAANGAWRLVQGWTKVDAMRSIGVRAWRWRERAWENEAARLLSSEHGDEPALPDLLRLIFLRLRRKPEQFNYNYYRHGMPRHLVALSFIESITLPQRRPVLDLGCGAGHITRALAERVRPTPVIGLDHQFLSLYLARRIAPGVQYVCGDAIALPFHEGSFGIAISSDVFHSFDYKGTVLREMQRVTSSEAELMIMNLRNGLRPHPYPGRDLSPGGYQRLAGHLDHRLIPDTSILERYLRGLGLPAGAQVTMPVLERAPRLSLLARKSNGTQFVDHGSFDGWPHARGELAVNPLYTLRSQRRDQSLYEIDYPSDFYRTENVEAKAYLPARFTLDKRGQDALRRGSIEGLQELVSRCAVLGLPPAYRTREAASC